MSDLMKACEIAVADRVSIFGENAKETKITQIAETKELYVFDFFTDHVLCGGGGLLIDKKDFSITYYSMPSYPKNIMQIIYEDATPVEIPGKYK